MHLDADSGTVTTYGNPTSATGRYGGAMAFAGADALAVANPGFNDAAGSLECWVNFTGTGGNEDGTILRLDGANPWSYHILERVDGNHVAYVTYDGQHSACVESSSPLTGWHQILATHSTTSGKIELFIDGVSQGTDTYTATTCAARNSAWAPMCTKARRPMGCWARSTRFACRRPSGLSRTITSANRRPPTPPPRACSISTATSAS